MVLGGDSVSNDLVTWARKALTNLIASMVTYSRDGYTFGPIKISTSILYRRIRTRRGISREVFAEAVNSLPPPVKEFLRDDMNIMKR